MATLIRTNKEILIDDEDVERVLAFETKWDRLFWVNKRSYVLCRIHSINTTVFLSRFILQYTGPLVVDHILGNKLDNRKSQLRIVTNQQNCSNRTKPNKNNPLGQANISIIGRKYRVRFRTNDKVNYIDYFFTLNEAIVARDAFQKTLTKDNMDVPEKLY